jgi:hypothetical protein
MDRKAMKTIALAFIASVIAAHPPCIAAEPSPERSMRATSVPVPSDDGPLELRTFTLKSANPEEVRIVILGSYVNDRSPAPRIGVDLAARTLAITDAPQRLREFAAFIEAVDVPSREDHIQRRLYEMWVRANRAAASQDSAGR